jgi:hypothetical protein
MPSLIIVQSDKTDNKFKMCGFTLSVAFATLMLAAVLQREAKQLGWPLRLYYSANFIVKSFVVFTLQSTFVLAIDRPGL